MSNCSPTEPDCVIHHLVELAARTHCKVHGDVGWKAASAVSAGFSSEAAHTVYLALDHTLVAGRGAVCLLRIPTTKTYCSLCC